jgi:hypothetical protein
MLREELLPTISHTALMSWYLAEWANPFLKFVFNDAWAEVKAKANGKPSVHVMSTDRWPYVRITTQEGTASVERSVWEAGPYLENGDDGGEAEWDVRDSPLASFLARYPAHDKMMNSRAIWDGQAQDPLLKSFLEVRDAHLNETPLPERFEIPAWEPLLNDDDEAEAWGANDRLTNCKRRLADLIRLGDLQWPLVLRSIYGLRERMSEKDCTFVKSLANRHWTDVGFHPTAAQERWLRDIIGRLL